MKKLIIILICLVFLAPVLASGFREEIPKYISAGKGIKIKKEFDCLVIEADIPEIIKELQKTEKKQTGAKDEQVSVTTYKI